MVSSALCYVMGRATKKLHWGTFSRKGRNFLGRICVFHRGSGNIRKYRLLDFSRRLNLFGKIYKIICDPNRTAFIALVLYDSGFFSYILSAEGLCAGNRVFSGMALEEGIFSVGSAFPLKYVPLFNIVHCIESVPGKGGILARAAGAGAIVVSKLNQYIVLKLRSGWLVRLSPDCMVSLGYASNKGHDQCVIKLAGKNRSRGIRPTVRGVAMNPCDHPHGGGNGKKSPPTPAVNAWGTVFKGSPTKNKKKDRLRRRLFKHVR